MNLSDRRKKIDIRVAEYRAAQERCRSEREAFAEASARQESVRQAVALAQEVAKAVQSEAHRRISDIVSRSLAAVFDDPYLFSIEFESKRNRTEARLLFRRPDGSELDPLSAAGGGVVDVAAFALRLSCIMLSKPPVRRLVIADEPFRFVSAEYRPRIRELLETLAKELGVQIVMVTHQAELAEAGTVYKL